MHRPLGLNSDKTNHRFVTLGGLLFSLLATMVWTDAAFAARLQFWRFDSDRNRLEFSTDQAVRPRVQLIPNPTRLVVDLPGIKWGRPKINRPIGKAIRTVRIAQFRAQTTRIVVELAPNYTLDPEKVKVQGNSPRNWSIQLPQLETIAFTADNKPPSFPSPSPTATPPPPPIAAKPATAAQINDVQVNPQGLFMRTSGAVPVVRVKRSRNKREITFDVLNTGVAPTLKTRFRPKAYGIKDLAIRQTQKSPPKTQIVLKVDRKSPDWLATANRAGIAVVPKGGVAAIRKGKKPTTTVSLVSGAVLQSGNDGSRGTAVAQSGSLATISRVYLSQNQLLIQADKPINFSQGWEGANYRLTIPSAQLATGLRAPRLGAGTSLSSLRLRPGSRQVSILARTAPGVKVAGIQRRNANTLVVILSSALGGSRRSFPQSVQLPPQRGQAQGPLPRVNRRIVVIDPGHGGRDPGAVGIQGLRETHVVLDISLEVSRILQRQGATVYLTRTREVEIDLAPRVALAQRARADIFVSIHANAISMSRPDVNGLETYHAPGSRRGALLARTIHNTILRSLNMGNRGVRSARFYVIRRTSMPSVLVETGFVTGAQDAPRLMNPAWRQAMAKAIARGILNYLTGRYN